MERRVERGVERRVVRVRSEVPILIALIERAETRRRSLDA